MALLEHTGRINLELENFAGAIKAFQRMRDVAEDIGEKEVEMKAYRLLGKTLQNQTEHERAIFVLKRLLQVAWFQNNLNYEMKAYEMIGLQYFYMRDLAKADYYFDRFMRGKFEVGASKTRDLSLI